MLHCMKLVDAYPASVWDWKIWSDSDRGLRSPSYAGPRPAVAADRGARSAEDTSPGGSDDEMTPAAEFHCLDTIQFHYNFYIIGIILSISITNSSIINLTNVQLKETTMF